MSQSVIYKCIFVFIIVIIVIIAIFVIIDGYCIVTVLNYFFEFYTNPEYLDTDKEWCHQLRENYSIIYDEYKKYIESNPVQRFGDMDDVQKELDTTDIPWNVIMLKFYNKNTDKIKYFPKTNDLIKKIPECTLAMFSVLPPGKELKPHIGPYKGVYRYHLALLVPRNSENCFIEVNNKKYVWKTGEDVMFDDTYMHSVKNNTNETRVVLFLDIKKNFNNLFLDTLNNILFMLSEYNITVRNIADK